MNSQSNDLHSSCVNQNNYYVFTPLLSQEVFISIVAEVNRSFKKRVDLSVNHQYVIGTVTSQSGLSDWTFSLDFNDKGDLTGNYIVLSCNNTQSNIPVRVGEMIKQRIQAKTQTTSKSCISNCCNCGAAIQSNQTICPYCGTDQRSQTEKIIEQRSRLATEEYKARKVVDIDYQKEIAKLEKEVDKYRKKSNKDFYRLERRERIKDHLERVFERIVYRLTILAIWFFLTYVPWKTGHFFIAVLIGFFGFFVVLYYMFKQKY